MNPIRSKIDELAIDQGCHFDLASADRVRFFFNRFLRHSKGEFAGKPFELQPWQWDDIIAPLFGWKRADGTRRYRRGYVEIPKKSGKSTLASGISLYLLVGDGEAGAEVYTAAADREQASIIFNEAANMVEVSPALRTRLEVIRSNRRVVDPIKFSTLRALSADVPTKEGLNAHGILFDELHAQRHRDLWDALRYAGKARRQPVSLALTTAGFDRSSICWDQHCYAIAVQEARIPDTAFLPVIYAADLTDDWTSEDTWRKANPSLGVTLTLDSFHEDCEEAKYSATQESRFRRYSLNQWVEQEIRWMQMNKWDACQRPIDWSEYQGKRCIGALDLATTTDICAFVLLFLPDDDGGPMAVLPQFWCAASALKKREKLNLVRLDNWCRSGHITICDGDCVEFAAIKSAVSKAAELYDLREVAIDRWNAAQTMQELSKEGHSVITFGQGYASMSAPMKYLEQLVLGQKIVHDGNPVLRWMVGNCQAELDSAANVKPSKKHSTEKIDGVVATIMAVGRAMVYSASRYESGGVVSL